MYAHGDKPEQDYNNSQLYFFILTEQSPESSLAEEAEVWLSLFETIEKIHQIDVEIERQKKNLAQ